MHLLAVIIIHSIFSLACHPLHLTNISWSRTLSDVSHDLDAWRVRFVRIISGRRSSDLDIQI